MFLSVINWNNHLFEEINSNIMSPNETNQLAYSRFAFPANCSESNLARGLWDLWAMWKSFPRICLLLSRRHATLALYSSQRTHGRINPRIRGVIIITQEIWGSVEKCSRGNLAIGRWKECFQSHTSEYDAILIWWPIPDALLEISSSELIKSLKRCNFGNSHVHFLLLCLLCLLCLLFLLFLFLCSFRYRHIPSWGIFVQKEMEAVDWFSPFWKLKYPHSQVLHHGKECSEYSATEWSKKIQLKSLKFADHIRKNQIEDGCPTC